MNIAPRINFWSILTKSIIYCHIAEFIFLSYSCHLRVFWKHPLDFLEVRLCTFRPLALSGITLGWWLISKYDQWWIFWCKGRLRLDLRSLEGSYHNMRFHSCCCMGMHFFLLFSRLTWMSMERRVSLQELVVAVECSYCFSYLLELVRRCSLPTGFCVQIQNWLMTCKGTITILLDHPVFQFCHWFLYLYHCMWLVLYGSLLGVDLRFFPTRARSIIAWPGCDGILSSYCLWC